MPSLAFAAFASLYSPLHFTILKLGFSPSAGAAPFAMLASSAVKVSVKASLLLATAYLSSQYFGI